MSKEAIGQCKLCLTEKKLCSSHIIPEFMYVNVYDNDPKKFYQITGSGEEVSKREHQKGLREYLLCEECESKLSKNEKYADENIYGKNKNCEAVVVENQASPDGTMKASKIEGLNYTKFKLFLDSILWRGLVCSIFETPDYGEQVMEKLRLSLYNEVPLDEDEFPCVMIRLEYANGELANKMIVAPYAIDNDEVLNFFIDGIWYEFFMKGQLLTEKPFIQGSSKHVIFTKPLHEAEHLYGKMKKVIKGFEELGLKKKK